MHIDEKTLEIAIRKSWCKETSCLPERWSLKNPAEGQCASTSLVVQDYLHGDILYCFLHDYDNIVGSHCYNRLPNGRELDLTREQYPCVFFDRYFHGADATDRKEISMDGYLVLKKNVESALKQLFLQKRDPAVPLLVRKPVA